MAADNPIQPVVEPVQTASTPMPSIHPQTSMRAYDVPSDSATSPSNSPATALRASEPTPMSVDSTQTDTNDSQPSIADPSPTHTLAQAPVAAAARPTSPSTGTARQKESRETVIRPLNVKDALTYLDQVKVKFADQPNVYNDFLDIMKDFKSQKIDTPGIIEKVSSLFQEHPSLIAGFNTFLPEGYCIECTTDELSRDIIKVTTPSGSTSTTPGGRLNLGSTSSPPRNRQWSPETAPEDDGGSNRRSPIEFNHAIKYINKIKSRFEKDPETYKQFLEILQTYQKEQHPIQKVYAEVRILFNGAEDLLDEFKQFLPDTSGQADTSASRFAPGGAYTLHGRKKRGTGATNTPSKRFKLNPELRIETSDVRGGTSSAADALRPLISAEETEFFDKVKKYINDTATYNAFVKVLNLFTQQIVDQNVLISRVEGYIGGNKSLFDMFKALVGFDGKDEIIENLPTEPRSIVYSRQGSLGPSYRAVPKTVALPSCSGRDALCQKVLNDKYVSHPSWASEDSECVTLKKNPYEEALHRVEEERYDYDLNIEANLNVIVLLEPVAKKISGLSVEEKADFRLSSGLGGPSEAIYKRIIKKVYGASKGLEIIDLLHNNPSQSVTIVLKRLRQKDDEWKRAQREWNKIWREVESKNYFKSLDHRGITFKAEDRKTLATKVLLDEIEGLRKDQNDRHRPQLTFDMKHVGVCRDINRLLLGFLSHQQLVPPSQIAPMRRFLEEFVPSVFCITDEAADADTPPVEDTAVDEDETMGEGEDEGDDDDPEADPEDEEGEDEDEDDDDDDDEEDEDDEDEDSKSVQWYDSDGDNFTGRISSRRTRARSTRAMAKRALEKKKTPQNTTPKRVVNQESKRPRSEEMDVDVPQAESLRSAFAKRKMYNFFGDEKFYRFFRLYQFAYYRLSVMKNLDADYRRNPEKARAANKVAVELGVRQKKCKAADIDMNSGYYNSLLSLITKLLEDDVDQPLYEDCVRYMFGTHAYLMFTFEKLAMLLLQSIQNIAREPPCQELMDLFHKDHLLDQTDAQVLGNYRIQAERILGEDEHVFNIGFDTQSRTLSIQLLGQDDALESDKLSYEEYISNYMEWSKETQGVSQDALSQRYLKRNKRSAGEPSKAMMVSGMQYKICRDTYHMFYIIGTEDAYIRQRSRPTRTSGAMVQRPEWKRWLDAVVNERQDGADKTAENE